MLYHYSDLSEGITYVSTVAEPKSVVHWYGQGAFTLPRCGLFVRMQHFPEDNVSVFFFFFFFMIQGQPLEFLL